MGNESLKERNERLLQAYFGMLRNGSSPVRQASVREKLGDLSRCWIHECSLEPVDDIGTLELKVACDPALVSLLASVRDTRLLFDAAQDRTRIQGRQLSIAELEQFNRFIKDTLPHPKVPLEDVLLILRVRKDERREIYFQVGESDDPAVLASGVGAIEELTPDFLRIYSSPADAPETGETRMDGCSVSLKRADWFALWDWRNAQEDLTNKLLQERYDANLTVAFGRTRCVLRTLRATGAGGVHGTS